MSSAKGFQRPKRYGSASPGTQSMLNRSTCSSKSTPHQLPGRTAVSNAPAAAPIVEAGCNTVPSCPPARESASRCPWADWDLFHHRGHDEVRLIVDDIMHVAAVDAGDRNILKRLHQNRGRVVGREVKDLQPESALYGKILNGHSIAIAPMLPDSRPKESGCHPELTVAVAFPAPTIR